MSTLTDLAEAVKEELAVASLSQSFTPVRAYRPRFSVADLAELQVMVVARNVILDTQNRAKDAHDCMVEVWIAKRIGGPLDDNATIDPWMDFTEEIVDFLRRRKLSGMPAAKYQKAAYEVPYDDEELEKKQTFESLVSVAYKVFR